MPRYIVHDPIHCTDFDHLVTESTTEALTEALCEGLKQLGYKQLPPLLHAGGWVNIEFVEPDGVTKSVMTINVE